MGESVLFDEGGCCCANAFGKGQDSELELAKGLLDLACLQLGSGALKSSMSETMAKARSGARR